VFIDSHCHLNYLNEPEKVLQRARSAGVSTCLCISVEQKCINKVLALADAHDDVWASVGLHPDAAAESLDWIEANLSHPRVLAVGETGLDYLLEITDEVKLRQQEAFDFQLQLALKHNLPIIVHTRNAQADTLALMAKYPQVEGVLHCFTESWDMAEQALDMGYYISISGIVTFKNAESVREVARQVPIERLLIETDAPWLAPVPNRGKDNEPAFVADTAKFLAELRDTSLELLAAQTSANFNTLFKPS
jgi:TatD DNase family protein|tara:strand:- start:927 stop:1673 length:747 start_codon:yes stop_codon:yes gene_type:complete